MTRSFKKSKSNQGNNIKANETPNYDARPPIFSLEKIQPGKYCLSSLDKNNKSKFADAIFKRRLITWNKIKQIDRHALGTEKITKSSIKAPMPKFITEDVTDFLVFRYNGIKPMVGYRQREIFFVLWFDHDFTLYDH